MSELLILCGLFFKNHILALIISGFGIFVGTVYSIWLYNKIIFGLPNYKFYTYLYDLTIIEICLLIPLMFHILWIGIYPKNFIEIIYSSVIYNYQNLLNV